MPSRSDNRLGVGWGAGVALCRVTVLKLLLLVTIIESLATVLVERGIYFYTHEHLGFTDTTNLFVALLLGLMYVVGALTSSRVSTRTGPKRLLQLTITGQFLCHAAAVVAPSPVTVFGVAGGIGLMNGLKWPVIESYVAATRGHHGSAGAIGLFNIAWSVSVPVALWVAGPLLVDAPPGGWWVGGAPLFITAAGVNVASLALLGPLGRHPACHRADDRDEAFPGPRPGRLRLLLRSSRWTMLASFCLLFVLAPLMPTILGDRLGLPVFWAAPCSAVIDVVRVMAFVVLWRTEGWHNRAAPLVLAALAVPMGFVLIVTGGDLVWVLVGQAVFGVAMGLAYYAALYYAMRAENGSVNAGGVHEGLIGVGFFVGPLLGLLGSSLADLTGGLTPGVLVSVTPLVIVCGVAALRPLGRDDRV